MEDSIWAKKITRNLSEIKDRTSVVLEQIIDFLIENGIIQLCRRSEVDAIVGPSAKIDHILQLVLCYGEKAYDVLLEAFEKYGIEELAEMIRSTDVPLREGSGLTLIGQLGDDDDWLERSMSICTIDGYEIPHSRRRSDRSNNTLGESVDVMKSRQDTFEMRLERLESGIRDEKDKLHSEWESVKTEKEELQRERAKFRSDNETFLRKMENQLDKERDDLSKEKEEIRKVNEELRQENKSMNSKFQALADEFTYFKCQANQENADKNRQIEKLKQKNKELQQSLENAMRRLTGKNLECEGLRKQKIEMKIKYDEKVMALHIMNNCLRNTESGKAVRNMIDKKVRHDKLPPISKQTAPVTRTPTK